MKAQITMMKEILDILPSADKLEISVTVYKDTEAETTLKILDDDYARHYLLRNFLTWHYATYLDQEDIYSVATDFYHSWQMFTSQEFNKVNWAKIYETMMDKGNPLENYDRYEETSLSYTGKESTALKTPANGYSDTVTNETSPENSGTYVPVNKVITHMESRNDTSERTFTDRMDETISHIHGNIGVTTQAQLIKESISVRVFNVADSILNAFAYAYLF